MITLVTNKMRASLLLVFFFVAIINKCSSRTTQINAGITDNPGDSLISSGPGFTNTTNPLSVIASKISSTLSSTMGGAETLLKRALSSLPRVGEMVSNTLHSWGGGISSLVGKESKAMKRFISQVSENGTMILPWVMRDIEEIIARGGNETAVVLKPAMKIAARVWSFVHARVSNVQAFLLMLGPFGFVVGMGLHVLWHVMRLILSPIWKVVSTIGSVIVRSIAAILRPFRSAVDFVIGITSGFVKLLFTPIAFIWKSFRAILRFFVSVVFRVLRFVGSIFSSSIRVILSPIRWIFKVMIGVVSGVFKVVFAPVSITWNIVTALFRFIF